MYIAKRFFETPKKAYKKGEEVPAEVAVKFNSKYVELVEGAKVVETIKEEVIVETVQSVDTKPKKGKKVKEEILVEEPTDVEVEITEE